VIVRTEKGLEVSGNITMTTVNTLFQEGLKINGVNKANADLVIDFSRLEKVDSSAVSLMLSWLREAQLNKVKLSFENVPVNLMSLTRLYGVAELLKLNQNQ
jgi:phospholipid transport system transporter-binding protein